MRKFILVLRETAHLIWRNKLWFLAPILLSLALITFLVYTLGPAAVVSFLYAGI
ncbi:MAG: hypothetical protein JXB39_02190 [Deltaproteobacteria bacterium]|nr:hypothetical protein [Deltaproteobacteria bacterium]